MTGCASQIGMRRPDAGHARRRPGKRQKVRAFSSEAGTGAGSREENASTQNSRARF
jgi:hypothetical protein